MKIKTALLIVLVMLSMFGSAALAQGQIQVQNIQSQMVGSPDSAGYVQFNVTADAWNPTIYGTEYSVQVQGLNSNGSAVTTMTLWGRVDGQGWGTLTGQGSLPQAVYGSIVNWAPIN
jgi:hypothetical protein